MRPLGHLYTNKSWITLLGELADCMSKWGIADYVRPVFRDSAQTGSVTFLFAVKGKWGEPLICRRFRSPEQNLAAIVYALDAARKAEQRGLSVLLARAVAPFALPDPERTPTEVVMGRRLAAGEEVSGVALLQAWRLALKRDHPDTGGSDEVFKRLMAAGRSLKLIPGE